MLNLNSNTQFLSHPYSATDFQSTNIPAIKGYYLKLWSNQSFCYLVFDDERVYNSWNTGIQSLIKSSSNGKNNYYGCIYDLSINDLENKIWLNIKLTAIKNDVTSITEYFLFDLSQKNLYISVKEVLASIDGHLDPVNTCILREFLLDIIRNNFLAKALKDYVSEESKDQLYPKFQFSYEKNSASKNYFKNLKKGEIEENISKLMEISQVVYDQPSSALKVLELQKLSLQSDLNELFSKANSLQSTVAINNIEKNLEKILKQRENTRAELKKDSCLGRVEACDCSLF